jgi:hypothetical protein
MRMYEYDCLRDKIMIKLYAQRGSEPHSSGVDNEFNFPSNISSSSRE